MKNRAKKIIAIGLGICVLAVWFVFLFFVNKPYTEKVAIWLPNNYKLENSVSGEVVSIMPTPIDKPHQSNEPFYSQIDMDSFKKLFGKSQAVAVKIQAGYCPSNQWYRIVYQSEPCCEDKSFIVWAQEFYDCNMRTLSEMKLRDGALFLKHKRDKNLMFFFSILGFVVIAGLVYLLGIDRYSKQSSD